MIQDLAIVADSTAPLSSAEALQDLATAQKHLQTLEQEVARAQALSSAQEVFSSPTAKAMSDQYSLRLMEYATAFRDRMALLLKRKQLLVKKLRAVMEYFGEDPMEMNSSPIFSALKEFRRALAFSKEAVEWKLSRQQSV